MMELDELKKSWEEIGLTGKKLNNQEVKNFLQNSSRSPLVKIRKNIMAELFSILPIVMGFYIYVFIKKDPSNLFYIGLGVLTAITMFLLVIVFPRLYKHTESNILNKSISVNLQHNIELLQNDIDFYEKVMLFLYIPACFAGFALSAYFNLKLIIAFLLFFPIYYFIVKKWVKYFYGKYIEELEEMVAELEE